MATISSNADFKTFILQELGSPVITVELADVHLQQAIDEAIYDFTRYNYTEGNYRDFMVLNLSAHVSDYNLSGSGISDVVDILLSIGGSGSINTLFSPANMIISPSDLLRLTNFQILDYHMGQMKLAEINEYFTIQYKADWHPGSQILKLTPTPTENMQVMMEIYKKENATILYNNQLVKKMAIAKALIIWGRILKKYAIGLPGGGNLNGPEIYQEGKDMEAAIMQQLKDESEPCGFFCA